jgi:hypothetical protein
MSPSLSAVTCAALLRGEARRDEIEVAGDARSLRRLADLLLVFAATTSERGE